MLLFCCSLEAIRFEMSYKFLSNASALHHSFFSGALMRDIGAFSELHFLSCMNEFAHEQLIFVIAVGVLAESHV